MPPVFIAIRFSGHDVLLKILEHGPNKGTLFNGDTALHFAVRENKIIHAEFLLSYGYSIEAMNKNKQTPIQLAKSLRYMQILAQIDNPSNRQKLASLPKRKVGGRKVTIFKNEPLEVVPHPNQITTSKPAQSQQQQQNQQQKKPTQTQTNNTNNYSNHSQNHQNQNNNTSVNPNENVNNMNIQMPNANMNSGVNMNMNMGIGMPMPMGMGMSVGMPPQPPGFVGGFIPQQQQFDGRKVLIQRDEFSQLQKRVVELEQVLSQILPKFSNNPGMMQPSVCFACNGKPGLNICPVCGHCFCHEDFCAHIAKGCKI
ncbi:hypothetical protein TRFO_21181 [Tritrichomonas foetus]|uniref:Uncharacterized protein n=1 Tax=Tritrichomonas foetus TaxID=1144522 RepID=A0A1J4KFQ3_9EUKA|nr:hypothetical protein TRFO_21181 [Tritrichomonas foetus]|eukprot:OHT09760.1 hypothetical protein TRFO_21181 [Tritrichomonas foetus]